MTSSAIIVSLLLLLHFSLGEGFGDYVSRMELARLDVPEHYLLDRYRQKGNWGFVHTPSDLLAPDIGGMPPSDRLMHALPPEGPPPGQGDSLQLGQRLVLFDADQHLLMGSSAAIKRPTRALRLADGRVVGYLGLAPAPGQDKEDSLTHQFLQGQTRTLAWSGVMAILLSALAAAWLARHFRKPVSELAQAVSQLARGERSVRAPAGRSDELGELARDFNRMAHLLEQSEQARRQFIADTSHELRTPLTVMRACTEAMRDGIIPLDQRGIARLDSAITDLEHLTNDLYQLARADLGFYDYRFKPIPLSELFDDLSDQFSAAMLQAGLRFHAGTAPQVSIHGDAARLRQLFGNLLGNSLRYTAPNGEVMLTANVGAETIDIMVDDTAPGVPDEAMPRLFDRFFRGDASRSRTGGGTGLGLSICQSIVTGHGGGISASHSPLGGLRITVRLPRTKEAE